MIDCKIAQFICGTEKATENSVSSSVLQSTAKNPL